MQRIRLRSRGAFFTMMLGGLLAVPAVIAAAEEEQDFPFEPSSMPFRAPTELEPIADGVYTFRWGAARSLVIVTDAGVIVVDPLNYKSTRSLSEALAKVTDQPVKYVVYSHSHVDRAAGARIFQEAGAQIVAHEKCRENLEVTPYRGVVMPDITFDERYTIELGGRTLELYYFGPSHDNCLITMWPRHLKAIYLVNLAQPPNGWVQPWEPMGADFYFSGVVDYLQSVEALVAREDIESVIGGWISIGIEQTPDGKRRPFLRPAIGPVKAVSEAREFWQTVLGDVEWLIAQRNMVPEVPELVDLDKYEARLERYDEAHFKLFLRRVATYYTIGW